jgi:hypothetical protein
MRKYFFIFLLAPVMIFAQPKTFPVTTIPVLRNGNPIQNAWVGGFNNPVFSLINIPGDTLQDLFIYDKAGWKGLVYRNTGSRGNMSFTYAPEYELMFPTTLKDWAVMRDYNHDGVSDIFAVIPGGMAAYRGYALSDGFLGYSESYPILNYSSGAFRSAIWTFPDNMPVIMDINGDGALDILAPQIGGGITLFYYRNVAIDSGYSPDSLVYTLGSTCRDQAWGLFEEDQLDCGVQLHAVSCKKEMPLNNDTTGRDSRHQGGACFGFHYRNDTVVSLILADILCTHTKFLENTGTAASADVTYSDSTFPNYDVPVNIPIAPCAYGADINNDGFEDLLFAPFASNINQEGQSQDVNVVSYYQNNGIDSINKFHYVSDTTITGGIDVGTESHAVFTDYNHDGLMDIVIGNYGQFSQTGFPTSYLALYQNTGTNTAPEYVEKNLNWSNLTPFQLNGLYPAFGDLDGDSMPDMVVGDSYGDLNFFHNTGATVDSFPSMTAPQWFGLNVGNNAAPFIYDVNGDSLNDLLVGTKSGSIYYFPNFGTKVNPYFTMSTDSVNKTFGNIEVYDHTAAGPPPGYAAPIIHAENGQMMLYCGTQLGFVYKYLVNPDSLMHGSFTLLDSNMLGTKPGLRSTVSIADINGDGLNDYLMGNIRGGISLYSDSNWGNIRVINSIVESSGKEQMQVFPNPAKDKVICRLPGGAPLMTAMLYDLLGETITVPVNNGSDNTLTLSVGGVADGIYIIQAKDAHGHIYQSKIAIYK